MVIVLSESQTTSLSVFASSFGYWPVSWFPALTSGRKRFYQDSMRRMGQRFYYEIGVRVTYVICVQVPAPMASV